MTRHRPPAFTSTFLIGALLGAASVAIVALSILAVTMLGWVPLIVLLSFVGDSGGSMLPLLVILPVALLLAGLLVMAAMRWALIRFARWPKGPRTYIGMAVGCAVSIALAIVFAPTTLKDMAARITTGESLAQRAALPATDAEMLHMRTSVRPAAEAGNAQAQFELGMALLHGSDGERPDRTAALQWIAASAAQPAGVEARLLQAVERTASLQTPSSGQLRVDRRVKAAALLALQPTLPAAWQPVMLGAAAQLQDRSDAPTQPTPDTVDAYRAAALAGSAAFAVQVAIYDEAAARNADAEGRTGDADAHFARALEGYARAGADYEVARLQHHQPQRAPATTDTPLARHRIQPDAALSQRLLHLANLLDRDAVQTRVGEGHRELAMSAALMAFESSPDPAAFGDLNPTQRWKAPEGPFARWWQALLHARGDCMAALELSELTRSWEGPPVIDRQGMPTTPLDDAWAMAWAERAARCAAPGEQAQQVARRINDLKALIPYRRIPVTQLDAARAGANAMVEGLR